jgi:hypothetical protein
MKQIFDSSFAVYQFKVFSQGSTDYGAGMKFN